METIKYVDTHCHLDMIYQRLRKSSNYSIQLLSKNWEPGFEGCLTVFSSSFDETLEFLTENHKNVYGALGIHPHSAYIYNDEMEEALKNHLSHPKVIALGEIGLDYEKNRSPKDLQINAFIRQIKLGVLLDKPIVIHTRKAEKDTLEILRKEMPKNHKFHLHCYTDSFE